MAKTEQRIDLLGTSFSITVTEDPVYFQSILAQYRMYLENVQKVSKIKNPLNLAILAGFQLYDDLEKQRNYAKSGEDVLESKAAEKTVLRLIERIDKTFSKDSES
ncbi:MAG: cell division protein ZapA [Spirochaetaceae bacterium]|nr:cell division protein ZapA [Spirochaetaceae bacterium]